MLSQLLIHLLLQVRPGSVQAIAWGASILAAAILTRWVVRRRQSASMVRELKDELRAERRQAAREADRLERQRDRLMTLAFGKAIEQVKREGVANGTGPG